METPEKKRDRIEAPMTPNTQKRKSRLAEELSNLVLGWNMSSNADVVEVLLCSLKKLDIIDDVKSSLNVESSAGRKMTSFETRKLVWDFLHNNETPSTITSRSAKLKVAERANIQLGLDFCDTTHIVLKRKKQFYENNWFMLHITYQELYQKYIENHPENRVSRGTFHVLKPFYIRTETEKDIEMCCCKLHLHARWTIETILESAKRQEIPLPFSDCISFFEHLTANCPDSSIAYIDWSCTSSKKEFCNEIKKSSQELFHEVTSKSNDEVLVSFTLFQMLKYTNKRGEEKEHLKPVDKDSSMKEIISFAEALLPTIIHHRNHLRHYRNSINTFRENFHALSLDIDFSENLQLPVKFEPQSMHWYKDAVTVHSGIVKFHGEKVYHPYISDDKKHDQKFVKLVLRETIESIESFPELCIVESDNCNSQYKSAQHFEDIQSLADLFNFPIICVFSVAGHGKGEVDHVGGLAKCAIRRYIGTRGKINNANDCCKFLQSKFGSKSDPSFHIYEMKQQSLDEAREESQWKDFPTIHGSDEWHAMVFKPQLREFKAAPHLCVCDMCMKL